MPSLPMTSASGSCSRLQLRLLQMTGTPLRRLNLRGFGRLTHSIGKMFPATNAVRIVDPCFQYEFPLADGYWSQLLIGVPYEPEIARVLSDVTPGTAFLDLGANFGYWSARAVGAPNIDQVIAIEASPRTFKRLKLNSELNAFAAQNRAIWTTPGQIVKFGGAQDKHAGASIGGIGPQQFDVLTTSIDAIAQEHSLFGRPVLVKLDVEGAEIAALQGARELLATHKAVVIYEEHGRDSECRTTRDILERFNLDVYHPHPCGLRRIRSLEQVMQMKTDPRRGYNLLAASPDSMKTVLASGYDAE